YTTVFLKILPVSTQAEPIFTPPTFVVRSTVGKGNEQTPENLNRPASDAALREYCDKHYHQLLPLIAEKVHQGKAHQDKLKEVKARLNFEGCSRRNSKIQEASQHLESRTPNLKGEPEMRRRLGKKRGLFNRLGGGDKGRSVSAHSSDSKPQRHRNAQREAESRYQSSRSKKWNPFSESVTTKERLHKERKRSRKVKIAEEDTIEFVIISFLLALTLVVEL
nr:reverse transcriptase domain-containing protein [Tanacetum cinerariifolium]